jgi:hypothetical protein
VTHRHTANKFARFCRMPHGYLAKAGKGLREEGVTFC